MYLLDYLFMILIIYVFNYMFNYVLIEFCIYLIIHLNYSEAYVAILFQLFAKEKQTWPSLSLPVLRDAEVATNFPFFCEA